MKKNFLILAFIITSVIYAHSGRTDANGGHWNRRTGEYHYHHGYSAHSHPNGVCPYEAPKPKKVKAANNEVITNLKTLGYTGDNAIKNFQRDNGLTPDGVAGAKTKQKIKEKLGRY